MTPILATLFDERYLHKGIALIRSLQQHHAGAFRLFVLALDEATACAVNALQDKRVTVIPLDEMLAVFSFRVDWDTARATRSAVEFYWTLTPLLPFYVMDQFKVQHATYIDADSYLFGSLDPLYAEIGDASVAVIPHRFPARMKWREKENGIYNVNFVYFKSDGTGLRALGDWALQCLEWCYQRTERAPDGTLRFGDQGYLDTWEEKYGAHVVKTNGANLAPWNQERFGYSFDNRLYVIEYEIAEPQPDGKPTIWRNSPDATILEHPVSKIVRIDPLLFYHFHEHKMSFSGKRDVLKRGGYPLRDVICEHVYEPYEHTLADIHRSLALA